MFIILIISMKKPKSLGVSWVEMRDSTDINQFLCTFFLFVRPSNIWLTRCTVNINYKFKKGIWVLFSVLMHQWNWYLNTCLLIFLIVPIFERSPSLMPVGKFMSVDCFKYETWIFKTKSYWTIAASWTIYISISYDKTAMFT